MLRCFCRVRCLGVSVDVSYVFAVRGRCVYWPCFVPGIDFVKPVCLRMCVCPHVHWVSYTWSTLVFSFEINMPM